MAFSAKEEAALKVAMQRKLRCMPNEGTVDIRDEFRTWARETLGVNVMEKPRTPPDPPRLVPVTFEDVESCREARIVKVREAAAEAIGLGPRFMFLSDGAPSDHCHERYLHGVQVWKESPPPDGRTVEKMEVAVECHFKFV
jgi:hypothetical protein